MRRFYRRWVKTDDFVKTRISIEETGLEILSDKPVDKKWLKQRIFAYRRDIQDYIVKDKRFLTALKPIGIELKTPAIIKQMAQAAKLANVGPMAAVAGAIAQRVTEDLLNRGQTEVIIENGGDIFLSRQRKERLVAVFAGGSKLSGSLSLLIKPAQTPCGVCTSTAAFGHSLSFGNADSAVILAKSAALADAAATATCNAVKENDDFNKAIGSARRIPGVFGVIIIMGNSFAGGGEVELALTQKRTPKMTTHCI